MWHRNYQGKMRMWPAVIIAIVVALIAFSPPCGAQADHLRDVPANCQEDMPCWTWSKMGNMTRGVYLWSYGERAVVDACYFAYLDHIGRINWRRTKRLKGDQFARANGCNPRLYAPTPSGP